MRLLACAVAAVFPLAAGTFVGSGPASAAPEAPVPAASIQKMTWLNDRRVTVWVNSPASGAPVEIQLLLPRDWNAKPDAKFPVVYMLDGLRATDDENGWTKDAGAVGFFADKNALVVLPVGGQSSFYADWLAPDNGRNYQWETFLVRELPPLLESQFRATDVRAVEGLSMGGTAAMMLAARNPGWVRSAASYSGFLTLTSLGMPQAVNFAMHDAGGYDSSKMFGPPSSPAWKEHDPYELADKLKGTALYVSSGNGVAGTTDPLSDIPGITTNYAGLGLEVLSRLSTQNFVAKLNKLNIPVSVNYRASGTHTWPYWDFEMRQAWPQTAAAIGVDATALDCKIAGAIAPVVQGNNWLGDCLSGEYQVPGGVAQDFRGGKVFYSQPTGAQPVAGAIGGSYAGLSGAASGLGFPTAVEGGLPDGRGRLQPFQHGSIYWTPQTGAQAVRGAIFDTWSKAGYERGPAGYPNGQETRTPQRDGVVQGFENGPMYFSAKTGAHLVQGLILGKYAQLGFENSPYGFPTTEERGLRDFGRYSAFEGGNIYWSPLSGAWGVHSGPIMDAWGATGFENGPLGFPISDEGQTPGGSQQTFQGGTITVRDGRVTAATLDGRPITIPGSEQPKPDPAQPAAQPQPAIQLPGLPAVPLPAGQTPAPAAPAAPATQPASPAPQPAPASPAPQPAAAPAPEPAPAEPPQPAPIPALGPEVRPN
ncbi:alpha/beta hydrolase-fold protein [Nocardia seriolae]|uniref:Diacylglycerol O-acyltransferase n=2 Tax=Nocardia seriolae TaxID=37332 RepID=A0ABC8AKY6_9NOCA|nr:alpha/beta hydrolase-fold protein [Nocardia seriolae]APA94869.1 Diacylglycerol O-acyltransferase [Nocardia seriolae]QOW32359.1 esterase [Nocardia seriolae]WNJ59447.1 alpha/beta hydrolase-fold protein [Nocardia seriolae]